MPPELIRLAGGGGAPLCGGESARVRCWRFSCPDLLDVSITSTDPTWPESHSPATATRSNRGFALSPRPVVEDRNQEPAAAITMQAAQLHAIVSISKKDFLHERNFPSL
jgi:hypothetical protein